MRQQAERVRWPNKFYGKHVRFTTGSRQGQTGVVTKLNGPKTVEVRMDAGFMLWQVKVRNLEIIESA